MSMISICGGPLCNNMLIRDIRQLLIGVDWHWSKYVSAVRISFWRFWCGIVSAGWFIDWGVLVFTSKK